MIHHNFPVGLTHDSSCSSPEHDQLVLYLRTESTSSSEAMAAGALLEVQQATASCWLPPWCIRSSEQKSQAERRVWLFAWPAWGGLIVCFHTTACQQHADARMRRGYAYTGKALPAYASVVGKTYALQ